MEKRYKETTFPHLALKAAIALAAVLASCGAWSQAPLLGEASAAALAAPPASNGGFFPLSDLRPGMKATAWTVFTGTRPEPMDVEILGVLRGARGPGQDMILAQLHGAKPEYTGVVAGMSGSPVYIGKRLLGSLSYRIGVFSKDPIAGITPIEQMLEVRNLPIDDLRTASLKEQAEPGKKPAAAPGLTGNGMEFQAMETPLVMSGFHPEAIRLWQQQTAGTGLDQVAAGGAGSGSSEAGFEPSAVAAATIVPGSAVSAQLIRGDLEIAATCTVTYVDPKQLLACGHPIQQSGPVSLPMTTTEVVATLASPLNAFKIINTGATIGTFTEDRDSAIRGVLGMHAHMIPMHITVRGAEGERKLNIEVLDLPSLTTQAVLVALYESLLQTNESTADTSYHVTGAIDLEGYPAAPLDLWAPAGETMPPTMMTAFLTGERFSKIYSNASRQGAIRDIDLHVEAIPRRVQVELETARLISSSTVHAGDTVVVEASIRPWREPARNVRIPVKLPARLQPGALRLLVSDAATLDRTLDQPRMSSHPAGIEAAVAQARRQHTADRIYVSLLVPETQAGIGGQTLSSLPLSVANAMETQRSAQDVVLNGESAEVAADMPAGGVLSGFQVLNLRVDPGSGFE